MRLLKPLATGVQGAENGSAAIFRRGTQTPATLYTDIQGDGSTTPSNTVDLNSNGRAVWFVNEVVDIIVYDSNSSVVATFADVDGASGVEVMSQSFTGTNYDTAVTGASFPVWLSTILDLWKTNAGALDWKVLVAGSPTTLQNAFSTVGGIVVNVKAPAYNAKGDGVADDTSAISAAFSAAAGGGIVYFPPGTYRITSVIAFGPAVSLWGAGAGISIITIDHATSDAVQAASPNTAPSSIRGLTIRASQANSGSHLKINNGSAISIYDCSFGSANTNGTCVSADNAATRLFMAGCLVTIAGASSVGVFSSTSVQISIVGCRFVTPAALGAAAAGVQIVNGEVVGCTFDCSGTSSGTGTALSFAGGSCAAVGNRFLAPSGGTINAIFWSSSSTGQNYSIGNMIQSSANWTVVSTAVTTPSAASHDGSDNLERRTRRYFTTDNTTPISIFGNQFGNCEVRRTNNANQTINVDTPASPGLELTLSLNNDQGAGSGTITLGAGFKGQAPFTVIANNVRHIHFRSVENTLAGGAVAQKYWAFVGTTGDVTP